MDVLVNKGYLLLAGLALAFLLGTSSAFAAQPTYGFAAYQVTVKTPGGVHSALLNETTSPSAEPGYTDLVLQVTSGMQNLTYSRLVNASYDLLPYFPAIGTQALNYGNGIGYGNGTQYGVNVNVNVTAAGSVTRTFGSAQYSLSVFSFAISGSNGSRSFSVNGTVETFPSQLVYSASAGNGTYSVQAVLQGTDLPLATASSASPTAAYAGAGVGAGALALGGALLIRRRTKKVETGGEKPLHWVD